LRSVKNRFGATDEIGVFEMTGAGLAEIANPSSLFLADREANVNGACVFAGMEGTRPLLVEIQALTASTTFAAPRRAVVGWDSGRLAMILAVLESRSGLALGNCDVYLNVAGGLRISEPAADLAVAAALASSASGVPVAAGTVVFGEVGLSGEVRVVAQMDARLKEAEKLCFTKAIIPKMPGKRRRGGLAGGLEVREILHLSDLLALLRSTASGGRRGARQGQDSMDHPSRERASHG
jgi:DNA repair protein RadA/Sms